MDKMPGLTFAQSQAAIYDAIERDQPELFAEIARKIKEGTWVPVGGMWVEPDANMPDGEALARQLLYGKRYFLDKFGVDVRVGWNPDTFGHNWQLPQILRRAGIDSYVFGRCAPGPDPTHFFWWEGMDGSRVLGYVPAGWYNVSLQDGTRQILETARKNTDIKDFMILYGAGDHGGGPRDVDLAAIKKFREDPNEPRLVFDLPEPYLKGIAAANGAALPVVKRELNFTFPACYTTQAATKKANRQLESLLVTAEKFSAIAATSGYRDYYPERDIDEAWKIVLRNQFHDILDGSSIGPVYDEVAGFYRQARTRGERALDFSLETIGNAIDTRGEGFPVVVYNPLFWERTEPVIVEVGRAAGREDGQALDRHRAPGRRRREGCPRPGPGEARPGRQHWPSGSSSWPRACPRSATSSIASFRRRRRRAGATSITAGPNEIENDFLKVRLDPKTGWIVEPLRQDGQARGPGRSRERPRGGCRRAQGDVGLGAGFQGARRKGRGGRRDPRARRKGPGARHHPRQVPLPGLDLRTGPDPLRRAAAARLPDAPRLAGAEHHDQGGLPARYPIAGGPVRDPLRLDLPPGRRDGSPGPALDRRFGRVGAIRHWRFSAIRNTASTSRAESCACPSSTARPIPTPRPTAAVRNCFTRSCLIGATGRPPG